MAKKTGKTPTQAKSAKPAQPSLPFAGEAMMRDIQRVIEGKNFQSVEELNTYLAALTGSGLQEVLTDVGPLSVREQAQELAWNAMEAQTEEQARELVRRALALDADCVDALVLAAKLDARSVKEAIALLEKAVEAGERSLGKGFFVENKGHFWGLIETRPYMRARQELAAIHRAEGHVRKAMAHFEALLGLNPNDNQGVRYELLGCYLECRELESARELMDRYKGDPFVLVAWARVLERYLSRDPAGAGRALTKARKANRFVELYLSTMKKMPEQMPETYSLGSEEEAICCVLELMPAWVKHRDALFWLLDRLCGVRPAPKRGRPS